MYHGSCSKRNRWDKDLGQTSGIPEAGALLDLPY